MENKTEQGFLGDVLSDLLATTIELNEKSMQLVLLRIFIQQVGLQEEANKFIACMMEAE